MRRQFRIGTFETASSAVHSLVISKDGMRPSNLPVNKSGVIHVPLTYIGKDEIVYGTQLEKLTFLLTMLWCSRMYDHYGCTYQSKQDLYEDYKFECIRDAVCSYAGAKDIKVDLPKNVEVGCDHQIANDLIYGDLPYVDIYSEESIQEFVFNDYISVVTGSD